MSELGMNSWEWDEPATVRETQVAVAFLAGDRAYKVKKAVDVGFLDLPYPAEPAGRLQPRGGADRRPGPDVNLGVADLSGVDESVCDHIVVMRRMPTGRRLTTLVAEGEPMGDTVTAIAQMIAAFHAGVRRAPEISAQGIRDAIAGRWEDSFAQVQPLRGTMSPGRV